MAKRKRPSPQTTMSTLGVLAPMVAATRMAGFALAPHRAEPEATRMVTEKMAASVESALRMQEAAFGLWIGACFGKVPTASEAQRTIANAGLAPYVKRVRSNAKRLGTPGA
ncbi:MAG: hypothetical protein MUC58_13815 [Rhizobiaceae bacterium]|nr:hypothetical protein [Rhizobiaceae bacterium]